MEPVRAASLFRAAADPLRLRILALLQDGEICVQDLTAALEVLQPAASRHLSALRGAGLATCRRVGRFAFYASPTRLDSTRRLILEAARSAASGTTHRADARRLREVRSAGGCCPEPSPSTSPEAARTKSPAP